LDADVIVVGAGPAGSTAACILARRGLHVLLLDRKTFPRDKICGDGFPPGSIEIFNSLGLGDKIRAAGFYPIHGIRLGSPSGRTWETSFQPKRDGAQFYIAPRVQLDAIVQAHAVEYGARFLQANVRGALVEDGRVVGVRASVNGSDTEFTSHVVIGADGATSVIGRALRPNGKRPEKSRSVAVRAYVDGIETLPYRVEFYFYKRLVPGYGWIFPLGPKRANVGVLMRADKMRESNTTLEGLLDWFMDIPSIRERLAPGYIRQPTAAWQLANGTHKPEQKSFDGALLVGDAAALVDPLTGEGIRSALLSATLAADVVMTSIERRDTTYSMLSEYDRLCDAQLGYQLRRSYHIQKWLAIAPWWVDMLFAMAGTWPRRTLSIINRVSSDFVVGRGAAVGVD
jgi:geranylgeranyl reductase family protein